MDEQKNKQILLCTLGKWLKKQFFDGLSRVMCVCAGGCSCAQTEKMDWVQELYCDCKNVNGSNVNIIIVCIYFIAIFLCKGR